MQNKIQHRTKNTIANMRAYVMPDPVYDRTARKVETEKFPSGCWENVRVDALVLLTKFLC